MKGAVGPLSDGALTEPDERDARLQPRRTMPSLASRRHAFDAERNGQAHSTTHIARRHTGALDADGAERAPSKGFGQQVDCPCDMCAQGENDQEKVERRRIAKMGDVVEGGASSAAAAHPRPRWADVEGGGDVDLGIAHASLLEVGLHRYLQT